MKNVLTQVGAAILTVKEAKAVLSNADPDLADRKRQRAAVAKSYSNFTPPEVLQNGFAVLPEKIPRELLKRLLHVHTKALPDKHSGVCVHDELGARARGFVPSHENSLEFWPNREGMLKQGTIHKSFEVDKSCNDLVSWLSRQTGRDSSTLVRHVDFMLSYPGQSPQKWHLDGEFSLAGYIVFLEEGHAPLFAPYEVQNANIVHLNNEFNC